VSREVRIVPVTPAAFERAVARDGAGPLERVEVAAEFSPEIPVTYEGLRQPAGHYLVRDSYLPDSMSGKYVLKFKRFRRAPEPQFFFHVWLLTLPPSAVYMGGA